MQCYNHLTSSLIFLLCFKFILLTSKIRSHSLQTPERASANTVDDFDEKIYQNSSRNLENVGCRKPPVKRRVRLQKCERCNVDSGLLQRTEVYRRHILSFR